MIGTEIIECHYFRTSDGTHFDTREEAERHIRICNDPENNKPFCAKSNNNYNYYGIQREY